MPVANPIKIMEAGIETANALKTMIIDSKTDRQRYGKEGKIHIEFTEWEAIGNWYNIIVKTYEDGEIERFGNRGIKAHAEAISLDTGEVVGYAEASCFKSEKGRGKHNWNQIASMAQTRAGSKAFKNALGWVVELAGLSSTPLEEMDNLTNKPKDEDVINDVIDSEVKSRETVKEEDKEDTDAEKAEEKDKEEKTQDKTVEQKEEKKENTQQKGKKSKVDAEYEFNKETGEYEKIVDSGRIGNKEEKDKPIKIEEPDSSDDLTRKECKELEPEQIGLWAVKKIRSEEKEPSGAELGRILMPYVRKRWISNRRFEMVKEWFMEKYMKG